MIGSVINERYHLQEELGQGGMGKVYKGYDTTLERAVAIKILTESGMGIEGRARLIREAQSIAKLNHPNIVTIFDVGETDLPGFQNLEGLVPFIVEEFVEGVNLYEKPPERIDEIITIAKQICAALDHAHKNEIIHRDLKPENIIITPTGTAKLMDFGLARSATSRLTTEGTIIGTVSYLAPEMALGNDVDARADLYALGVMLYELTTGSLPFTASDPLALISQHIHAPVVPPRDRNDAIPPFLNDLIVRLMSKDPADRPASAAQVMAALPEPAAAAIASGGELSSMDRIVGRSWEFDEAGEQIPAPLFVARQAELARMQAALEQTQNGKGVPLFVIGGPGRGKSALLNEFAKQATAAIPDLLVARGDCNAYSGAGDPYLPFRDALSMLTGEVEARFLSGQINRQQAERLWKALPLSVGAILDGGEDLLDSFVNTKSLAERARAALPEDSKLTGRLDKIVEKNQSSTATLEQKALFEAYTQVLNRVRARQPLVILLDDLQWADSGSISLLFHLVRSIRAAPILIVGAYRPEEVALGRRGERHPLEKPLAEFKRQYGDIWIDLAEADRAAGRQLVDLYLDSEPNRLGESFRKALFAQTGGQPLFTVELLRALQERADLIKDPDGSWFLASELDWNALPARVEGVIEERINCLEDDLRQILTVASVEGEDFTAQVIARVQERSTRQLVGCLSGELSKVYRLVGEKGAQELLGQRIYQYRFLHHLFQRYLYNQIGAIEREMLHQGVGEALEALYGEQAESIAAQLAWHFEASGQAQKAVKYLQIAGDRARLLYALPEAVDYYQRAIRLMKGMDDLELAARTQMKLGLAYHNAMQFEQARAAFDQGNKLWEDLAVRMPAVLTQAPHALQVGNASFAPGLLEISDSHLEIEQNCFCGLVAVTPEYGVRPDLAKSWEILDEGRKYVFHLREGLRWSDGQPLTAGDIEYTWKHILSSSKRQDLVSLLFIIINARAFRQKQLDDPKDIGVQAVDRTTLVVELVKPAGYFLQMLTHPALFPRPRHLIEQYGDDWCRPDRMAASGPFQLSGFQPGEKIVIRRNRHYHVRFGGNVERLEYRHLQGLETCTAAYHSDEVDIMYFSEFVAPIMHNLLRQHAGEHKAFPILKNNMDWFNTRIKPFDDLRVRQAWVMSYDSQAWIDQVAYGLYSSPAGGLIPAGMPGHSPEIGLPYNPPEARRLLAEAGYPGGRGFPEINYFSVKEYCETEMGTRDLAFYREQYGDNLGAKINFDKVSGKDLVKVHESGRHHIFFGHWGLDYPDPHNLLSVGILSVYSPMYGWHNPSYEQLVQTADETMDQAERIKLYQQADRILVQDAPCNLWGHPLWHYLVKPWVKNFDSSADRFGNFSEVILEGH